MLGWHLTICQVGIIFHLPGIYHASWCVWRREVESVICVSDRPKSGSVGRVGPESILSRFWVGRSENVDPKPPETAQNRLKQPKNSRSDPKFLRRAPRSGSVGRDRPTQNHSKWRPLGRSVGYADYNFYFASPLGNRRVRIADLFGNRLRAPPQDASSRN